MAELFVEHAVKQCVSGCAVLEALEYIVDDMSQNFNLFRKGFPVGCIDGVTALFLHQGGDSLSQRGVESLHVDFVGKSLLQSAKHNLVTAVSGYVAPDKLAVHTDRLARYIEFLDLNSGNFLEAFLHEIISGALRVIAKAAVEEIVGVKRRQEYAPRL